MRRRCDFRDSRVVVQWALIALAVGLVLNACVTVALWHRSDVERDRTARAAAMAVRIAEQTQRRTLVRERVCSQTNQGAACRALFDRLANAATPDQKRRLACEAVHALRERPPKAAHCPRIR